MAWFEFCLEGPPVPLRAKKKNVRRFNAWQARVRLAAQERWQGEPIRGGVVVRVATYYTATPPDVDNVLKPILDGLCGVVYVDDSQVYRVVSEKIALVDELELQVGTELAAALDRWSEVVHVRIDWESGE